MTRSLDSCNLRNAAGTFRGPMCPLLIMTVVLAAAPGISQQPPLEEPPAAPLLDTTTAADSAETPLLPPLESLEPSAPETGSTEPPATNPDAAPAPATDSDEGGKDDASADGAKPKKSAPSGQLPWSTQDRQAAPPTSPKEMLELFNIGESQLRSLFDGEPLGAADEETLVNLLFRFPRMGEENIFRWRTPVPLETLAAAPDKHRAAVVPVRGVVRHIERRELIPEIAALYDFNDYWVLTIDAEQSDHEVLVCTRMIPPQWGDESLEDAHFDTELNGFFLKTGSTGPNPQLIFAASRATWRPTSVDPQRNVTASHVLLAKHGVDIGRMVQLESLNGKPLGSKDRETFYEMLAAVRAVSPEEITNAGPKKVDLRALLIEPQTIHGHLLRLQIRAAKITRLQVDEPDVRDLFGVDHYYQIDAYLPLGDQSVRLGNDPDAPEYKNAFPITLCMVDLPESMKDVDKRMASGESPTEVFDRELVTHAFFYRIWSYRSQFIDERTPGKLQPAPMMLATGLKVVEPGGVNSDLLSLIFGVGFVSLLAIVCLTLWWTGQRDRAVDKQLQNKRFPRHPSLDELDEF